LSPRFPARADDPAEPGGTGATQAVAAVFERINLDDGVDKREALKVAEAYFLMFISGCGMADGVVDKGDAWEVATFVDYEMRAYEPNFVDKTTGRTSCTGHPTVVASLNPSEASSAKAKRSRAH
jgi:hypothetical protein